MFKRPSNYCTTLDGLLPKIKRPRDPDPLAKYIADIKSAKKPSRIRLPEIISGEKIEPQNYTNSHEYAKAAAIYCKMNHRCQS
ncbi:MAG: hypothetical protein ACRD6X_02385 [Pyrinomonadaceae bacterium]